MTLPLFHKFNAVDLVHISINRFVFFICKGSFTPSDSESGSESVSGIAIVPLGTVLLIYTSTIQTGA